MNLVKIMEWQLFRSLVIPFPTLAGGDSFKYKVCHLKLINMLEDTVACCIF